MEVQIHMIASIKFLFMFICSDPSLSSNILVIIYGFLYGFVYEYNCAHCKRIKWHSGLLLLFSSYHEWIYLAWVPQKSSALVVQQESGLAPSEGQTRGQDYGMRGPQVLLPRYQLLSVGDNFPAHLLWQQLGPDTALPLPVLFNFGFS